MQLTQVAQLYSSTQPNFIQVLLLIKTQNEGGLTSADPEMLISVASSATSWHNVYTFKRSTNEKVKLKLDVPFILFTVFPFVLNWLSK